MTFEACTVGGEKGDRIALLAPKYINCLNIVIKI